MSKALTAAAVNKYRPGPVRRRIRDTGMRGMFLIIEPSGHKAWLMRFRRPNGKPGKIVLGPVHSGAEPPGVPVIGMPLTLAGARQLAADIHRQRAQGGDPIGDHKAAKHRRRVETEERDAATFAAAVRKHIAEYARPETRDWRETAKMLGLAYVGDADDPEVIKGGLVARWGDRPVASIDGNDIWQVVDEARRVAVPGLPARRKRRTLSEARARRLFVALSSFYAWAVDHRRAPANPCANAPKPKPAAVRDRRLTDDEICWFWQACDTVDAPRVRNAPRPFAAIFKLLLLTGARRDEVAGMRRDELQADGSWRLPASRTKNKRPHIVPLSPQARELIAAVPGTRQLVFTTNGSTPPSGWSRTKRRLDDLMLATARKERGADYVIPPWRLHDLRRTAVTGMGELGIRPDVIELTVNHISGTRGGIAGVYNRSELLPERCAALERWATHVAGLVSGQKAKVVPLRGSAS